METTEQKRLALLQDISLTLAQSESIEPAFEQVLGHICRFMAWPMGHVYVWSEAADALVSSRVWYMEDASTNAPFRKLSEATYFKPGEGTVGQVWESGEAAIILDVRDETVFVRQMPVEEGGIRAYFAFPVRVNGQVAAVLEFFSPESTLPDEDITSLINHVGALLALAILRQESITELQRSKAYLEEAQRTAHVGHWEWDIIKNKFTWSPELHRIYGLSESEFGGDFKSFCNLIHPDDLALVQKKVEEAVDKGKSFEQFYRVIRPDGAERVIQSRGRPVYDRAGIIIKLRGIAQDMTELKEVELKLTKSVLQMSALMEIGQSVSATLDLELIYEQMLASIRPLIGAEAVLLFLKKGDMLEVAAFDQENIPDLSDVRVPLNMNTIVGKVWKSRQSQLIQGKALINRISPNRRKLTSYDPGAVIAVPIQWQTRPIGVLQAFHNNPDAFDESDLRLLESAASWTAIAIGNAHQYKQLQRRLHESEAILAISNAMTEINDLDELLRLIVQRVQDIITHADWTTIHLLHPETGQLELAASAGLEISPDDYLINTGEGIAGLVIADGDVINVPDLQTDPRRLPVDMRTQARALLSAPVESQRQRIGTISVQCATPDIFTEDDERLLTIFGVQAGMAFENASLYQVQKKARERAEVQKKRMQRLARRVVQAQEKERARIARELHDESGQSLTSLKISLDLIQTMLPDEMGDIKEKLADILALTDQTMTNLRMLSHNLRPPGLDAYGLDAALAGLCQDFANHTSVSIHYRGADISDLEAMTALSLYRVAQEALTNAVKHAEATEIKMTLSNNSDMITLTVEDNGIGFNPPDLTEAIPAQGAGLLGMVERLEMVDGSLKIESILERGSCFIAMVPSVKEAA